MFFQQTLEIYMEPGRLMVINPILHWGQIDPPVDYHTLIITECPKWADFW